MSFVLDTKVAIHLRDGDPIVAERVGYSRRKLLDRMIAAQAIVHRATVVTMNPDDFADIPGLDVLAW